MSKGGALAQVLLAAQQQRHSFFEWNLDFHFAQRFGYRGTFESNKRNQWR